MFIEGAKNYCGTNEALTKLVILYIFHSVRIIRPSVGGILGRSERGMQHNPLPFCAVPFSLLMICRGGILLKGY